MPAVTNWSAPTAPLAHGSPATQAWLNVALIVSLALLCAGYGRGVHELWGRRGTGAVIPVWRVTAFGLGIAALLIALTGPAHELAERSFAGHMTQHMILLVVAGPLLAAGAIGLPLSLAGPRRLRSRWARWRVGSVGNRLRRPGNLAVLAGAAQALVIWAWHLPVLYHLALRNEVAHAIEHSCFVGTATLLWSTLLGSERHRLPGPVAVLLLFATMLPAAALGAALTLAPVPLYPPDALAPAGGDALADQQLAGLVMWIPMDVLALAAALVVFRRWLARLDRTSPASRNLYPADQPSIPVKGLTVTPAPREGTR